MNDKRFMQLALRLARRALGATSPNPMVGAVLTRDNAVIGSGWHHQAGQPHAEIEALRNAAALGNSTPGSTLYVTLEPCSTHGRTPPCTEAIIAAGITRVVVAATDPNPKHCGTGFNRLRQAGISVECGLMAREANELNSAFNHWIVHRTPWVILKAAMTLDGKIATHNGESKWITSPVSRRHAMGLRQATDAILVGVQTVVADNPALTIRTGKTVTAKRRIVLDPKARTPLDAQLLTDPFADRTTIWVGPLAPLDRVGALRRKCLVHEAPLVNGRLDLHHILRQLGGEGVTQLLVEGGGNTHAGFLEQGQVHAVAFYYAPKVLGGRGASRATGGSGFRSLETSLRLEGTRWKSVGGDLLLTAIVARADTRPGAATI